MALEPKTPAEIAAMREGGKMLATVLAYLRKTGEAGMTPKDLTVLAARELKSLGGEAAFLGYQGFPDVICISVNEQVQHSIPGLRQLHNGDIVNYDFGVRYKNTITDGGITVCIGDQTTPDTARLLEGTETALRDGLNAVHDGCRVGDISAAIERTLKAYRLGIVRELVGHGVGRELHEDPEIPNYGKAGKGPVLRTGMTIAIEPITTLGSPNILQLHDGWTLITEDQSWAAQFEHSVLVTEDGYEILTAL